MSDDSYIGKQVKLNLPPTKMGNSPESGFVYKEDKTRIWVIDTHHKLRIFKKSYENSFLVRLHTFNSLFNTFIVQVTYENKEYMVIGKYYNRVNKIRIEYYSVICVHKPKVIKSLGNTQHLYEQLIKLAEIKYNLGIVEYDSINR